MQTVTVVRAMVCASLMFAAISCGGDDGDAEAEPRRVTTTAPEETTTTLDPEEAEKADVIEAYEAAIKAERDSSAPPAPDPAHPAIAETHTGLMLDNWNAVIDGLNIAGNAYRLPENSQARSDVDSVAFEEREGQRFAQLEVCTVSDVEEVRLDTGAVVRSGVWTFQDTEAMVNEGGVWKLAERRSNSRMEGVVGCATD